MDYSKYETTPVQKNKKTKRMFSYLLIITIAVGIYNVWKPLPQGISVKGNIATIPDSSITFLSDITFADETGTRKSEQTIFDEVFNMINNAHEYILIDMFLFNSWKGAESKSLRALSDELTDTLIAKKKTNPNITITVISDPINTVYGGNESIHFIKLRDAGISVIETNLSRLRDSNPLYSAFWRTFIAWWNPLHKLVTGVNYSFRNVPNPFDNNATPTTIRSYLTLLNFKANHRKVLITDFKIGNETKIATLVTSANPHDTSSAHTNVALRIDDSLWRNVLASEQVVATFSKQTLALPKNTDHVVDDTGTIQARMISEGKIKETTLELLSKTIKGDSVFLNMFYLSDRDIITALINAANRGTNIQLILDPNKDAFGHQKNGIPNRPVASELIKKSKGEIKVRWCDTHGEQCHSKLLLIQTKDSFSLTLGSANFTRRNVGDYNLETNILVQSSTSFTAFIDAKKYFDTLWSNTDTKILTTKYETYKDESIKHYLLYRIMEGLGTSSF